MRELVCLCMLLVSLSAVSADAATRTVCTSGCQYSNLQAAIDAAVPGDTILLRAGQTFTGNFTLRAKSASATAYITIRSDAADSSLPAAGVRLIPEGRPGANTARSALARLVGKGATYKSTPIFRTEAGAHHYRLMFLEIDGVENLGYETLVELGNNASQTSLSASPHHIVVDRVWLRGHPTKGMKRGIALNSRSTDVLNSYFDDFMSFSDSQAIGGFNGAGPFRIINNHLEASGENIMFGGADPKTANLVPSDIEIRGNYFVKDTAWQSAILKTPGKPSVSASSTSGSLSSGTHYFKVVAVINAGGGSGYSAASAESSVSVSAGKSVSLSWSGVTGADKYRIYRGTAAGAQKVYLETSSASTSFTYTGSSEKSGTPSSSGTKWTSKNLLELKNAQRVTIDGNIFERNWAGFQQGYAIVLTPRNQSNTAPWSVVQDVTFSNNIVRHVAAAIQILGRDYVNPSQLTRNIRITNNIFDDVSSAYGNTGRFLIITSGPSGVVVDHNTIVNSGTIVEVDGADVNGFVFTNNMSRHNSYGIKGANYSTGNSTINAYFPGAVVKANVLAGGAASVYPSGNYFPPASDFLGQFVGASAGDFRLTTASPYNDRGTDGKDIGVDVGALQAAQAAGDGSSGDSGDDPDDPPPPPAGNQPPVAKAGGPYSGKAGTQVLVDGSGSTDAEAPLVQYRWHFGQDIVLRAADVAPGNIHGRWARVSVSSAAGGVALENADKGEAKRTTALSSPVNYVDIPFEAASGVPYYVWLRLRAAGDSSSNDSVHVQFSGAVNASGSQIHRIGTTSSMPVVLEEGDYAGRLGWGWNDNGWGVIGTPVYFAASGAQTMRIQQREDGVMFDQVIISAAAYAKKSPGALKSDTTIVPTTLGTDTGITALFTYAAAGRYPVRLTVTDSVGQTASDVSTAVIGSSGSTAGGDPVADAGGPYSGNAGASITFDGRGSRDPDGSIASFRWHFGEDILIRAADVPDAALKGRWKKVSFSGAAGGVALQNPNAGDAKIASARSAPANYVDVAFTAASGVPYRVWLRMRAESDYYGNDSVFLQYSSAVDASGRPIFRIGTTSGDAIVLEEGRNGGVSGWGWNDNHYGALGTPVRFATSGAQTLRIQQREDGVFIDQIVISAAAYGSRAPGATKGDSTVVPATLGSKSGSVVSHQYAAPGVYPVALTVVAPDGGEDEDSTTATVK